MNFNVVFKEELLEFVVDSGLELNGVISFRFKLGKVIVLFLEVEIYFYLFVVIYFIDLKKYVEVVKCVEFLV